MQSVREILQAPFEFIDPQTDSFERETIQLSGLQQGIPATVRPQKTRTHAFRTETALLSGMRQNVQSEFEHVDAHAPPYRRPTFFV